MRKIFLSLAAICLSVNLFAYDSAVAGTTYYGSKCAAYGLSDGTVAITNYYIDEDQTEIVFPATIQVYEDEVMTAEYEVSAVGVSGWNNIWFGSVSSYQYNGTVTSLVFSEGIKKIEAGALYEVTSLASMHLPSTLTSIGNYAFQSCDALRTITCDAVSAPALGTDAFKGLASWDAIGLNCQVIVPSEAAKETYNTYKDGAGTWTYWDVFYGAGKVVVKSGTGIENTTIDTKAQKVIRNGQLVIIRDGQMFDATGARL